MSIPVIGTAIVHTPFWIQHLLDSIDYPTDNFVIFNNNGRGQITEELDIIAKKPHEFIKKITVCHLPANIGCSGAWNLIIKCYMNSPYWIITNHDVSFSPGFLEAMNNKAQNKEVGIINSNNGEYGEGAWDIFLIKDWVIQKYGLFDENLYPAYNEDIDYWFRFFHDNLKRDNMGDFTHYHGLGTNYYETGQQTKKGDGLEDKLNQVNLINFEYMEKKWGPCWRMTWIHPTPFNISGMPMSLTTYDLEYVRKKHLGF